MNPMFMLNLFKVFSSFSPIFALLILGLPLSSKKWFISVQAFFISVTVFLFLDGLKWINPLILGFYTLYIVGFNLIFTYRFKIKNFPKAFALSLMLSFLITEIHELPNFLFAYLGLFGHFLHPIHIFCHIYLLVVGYLAIKVAGLRVTKGGIMVFVVGLVCTFALYPIIGVYPVLERMLWFPFFAVIFYFWSESHEEPQGV